MNEVIFRVVRNDEEQYSVWPTDSDLPPGWSATGFEGRRDECLAHVDQVWTDMRPASVRRAAG
ncbi:MbtH family protein [Micromonospora sp. DT231]|uniref:MbtH family protein n=1 Tax=Micromonospora sp. DT231 TaxID=3416526 RepID=UPI003CF5F531